MWQRVVYRASQQQELLLQQQPPHEEPSALPPIADGEQPLVDGPAPDSAEHDSIQVARLSSLHLGQIQLMCVCSTRGNWLIFLIFMAYFSVIAASLLLMQKTQTTFLTAIFYVVSFPSHHFLTRLCNRKGIQPVKKLGVGLLMVTIWLELCTS